MHRGFSFCASMIAKPLEIARGEGLQMPQS